MKICAVLTEIDDALVPLLLNDDAIARLVTVRRLDASASDVEAALRQASFVLCHPGLLMALLRKLPVDVLDNCEFVQSTWAGVEALARFFVETLPAARRPTVVRFAGPDTLYGHQMAEFFTMMAVAFERRLFEQTLNQHAEPPRWAPFTEFPSLLGKTLGVLGYGAIGQHVARAVRDGFGMHVVALSNSGVAPHNCAARAVFRRHDQLVEFLRECDYVLALLPDTERSRGLLDDDDVLRHCKPTVVVVNAGRGSLISEQSILRALERRWIRGFIADVWPEEPLPASSPLWRTPGVVVSPHVAAKPTPEATARVFGGNLKAFFDAGSAAQLPFVLDYTRGY
jgi:glyoxylate/hydroxypyruvate reductase